ncbi:MAG: hypothetical protein KDD69_03280 [Bdellovibrionales bacterium]|nr:hypothetical protein [Bdellovibrionales bacterium]
MRIKRLTHRHFPFLEAAWLISFGPCFLFLCKLFFYFATIQDGAPASVEQFPFGRLLCFAILGPLLAFLALVTQLLAPVAVAHLEEYSERAGIGMTQLWEGEHWREKLTREVFRFSYFFGCGVGAWYLSRQLPEALQPSGFFAFWEMLLVVSFLAIVGPLRVGPLSSWLFRGNPRARYFR